MLKNFREKKYFAATKYSQKISRWCAAELLAIDRAIANKIKPNNEGFFELGDIELIFLSSGNKKIPDDRTPTNYWLDSKLSENNNFHWIIKYN